MKLIGRLAYLFLVALFVMLLLTFIAVGVQGVMENAG